MVRNYIFLVLFAAGLIASIVDIFRAGSKSKQVNVKHLYIENRIMFIAICIYIIERCVSSITASAQ